MKRQIYEYVDAVINEEDIFKVEKWIKKTTKIENINVVISDDNIFVEIKLKEHAVIENYDNLDIIYVMNSENQLNFHVRLGEVKENNITGRKYAF